MIMRSLLPSKLAVLALVSSTVACPSGYRLERIEGVGASIQPDMFVKLHATKDAA